MFGEFVSKRRGFVGEYYIINWGRWQDGRGAKNREKSAEFWGIGEKLEKLGSAWAMGKMEKIENLGGKIEKFSADRRAEWRKIETATGWRRQKIEKK